jgi:cysteine desulfurase
MPRYYFDHNATTPVAEQALAAMLPCFCETYGNASSIHQTGQSARLVVERARQQVAALLGCRARDVLFTSGGTESNNIAVLGTVRADRKSRRHVITTTIEHPAVMNPCQALEREGVEVTYVKVGSSGVVSPDDIRAALRPETVLITVMHANNELGTIQPLAEISRIAREAGVPFHSDGVQSTGKIATNVEELGVDFFSLSGHKIYGPKGVGALYVRKGVEFEPVLFGGSHERGRRPGTENVPGIAGLGAAAELAATSLEAEAPRLRELRDRLERGVLERIEQTVVNGGPPRVPNTTNIRFDHVEGEALVIALDLRGFAISSGSACSSGAVRPSPVLLAIGLSAEGAKSSVRFSLGKQNTAEQVDALLAAVPEAVGHLRSLSPTVAR